jgi:hypothetical protein
MQTARNCLAKASIAALADILVNASTCYDIWYELQNEVRRPTYEPIVEDFSIFFETTVVSHLISITVLLYSVNENRRDTHNVPALLKFARVEFPNDPRVSKIENSASSLKPLWKKISRIRNEVFGHRATRTSPNDIFAQVELSPQDFRSLITGYELVITLLAELFEIAPPTFSLSVIPDTERLMRKLHSKIKRP